MTNETGSEQTPASNPWERSWSETPVTPVKAKEAAVVKTSVEPSKGPWERLWGVISPTPSKPPVDPSKGSTVDVTSGDWEAINKKYKAGQAGRDATQLDILKQELAKETNPSNIASLKREIARAEKQKNG